MKSILCVGSYCGEERADGIRLYELDDETGALTFRAAVPNTKNPSYIAFSRDHRTAYACQELPDEASVTAYRVSGGGLAWTAINEVSMPGTGMCHIALSPDERWALCANFTTGNVNVCPVRADGGLGEAAHTVWHQGHSLRTDWFQDQSRCHQCVFTPEGARVVVCDMGGDRLWIYDFDAATGELTPHAAQPYLVCDPGDGPRHAAFSEDGEYFYAVSEITSDLVVYRYDGETGVFARLQKLPTVPGDFTGWHTSSEIMIPRGGRYIFVSNRGCNTIARFDRQADGTLQGPAAYFDALGDETRMFRFTHDERFAVIANQKSHLLSVCPYDAARGVIGAPTCALHTRLPAFVENWRP